MTVVTATPLKASEVPPTTLGKLALLASPEAVKEVAKRLSQAFLLPDIVTKPLPANIRDWFLSFFDERKHFVPLKRAFQEHGLTPGPFSLKLFIAYFYHYGQSDMIAGSHKKMRVKAGIKKRWTRLLSNLASEKTASTPFRSSQQAIIPFWYFRHIYVDVSSKTFKDFVKLYKAYQNEIRLAESLYTETGLRRRIPVFVDLLTTKLGRVCKKPIPPPPINVTVPENQPSTASSPSEDLPIPIVSPTPPERPPIIPNDQKRPTKLPPNQCLHLRTVFVTGGKLVCLDCDSILNV